MALRGLTAAGVKPRGPGTARKGLLSQAEVGAAASASEFRGGCSAMRPCFRKPLRVAGCSRRGGGGGDVGDAVALFGRGCKSHSRQMGIDLLCLILFGTACSRDWEDPAY